MNSQKTRELFRDRVRALGGSRHAADALDCSRSYVDMIIHGDRRPGLVMARMIERLCGIPMRDWVERTVPLRGNRK